LKENVDVIDELREKTFIQLEAYQRWVSSYYNERVCHQLLEEGDLVLRRSIITNAFKDEGKLKPN